MKAPFVKVTTDADGADITGLIERFKFDDTTEKDNLVTITIKDGYALEVADNPALTKGNYITFTYGYIGGLQSRTRRAKISRNETVYESRNTTTITATDQGIDLKKNSSNTVWQDMTSLEIVQAIASARGMGLVMGQGTSTKKWKDYPQGNKSDLEFIKELAAKEPSGTFQAYIKDKTMYYVNRPLAEPSKKTFEIGNSNITSFRPKVDDQETTGAATDYEQVAIDPETGEVVKSEKKEDTKLGPQTMTFNVDGIQLPTGNSKKAQTGVKKTTPSPDPDKENIDGQSNSKITDEELGQMTGTLTAEGDPTIESDTIITIGGMVAKVHSGNWLIVGVAHDINPGSAYIMSLSLKKNGTNKAATADPERSDDVNNSEGSKTSNPTKRVYDVNSNRIQ